MGITDVFKFLTDLHSTSSVSIRLAWILWILFIAIYVLIERYEKKQGLLLTREKAVQNYHGTLYIFGIISIIFHYGSTAFTLPFYTEIAVLENSKFYLGLAGFTIMLFGLYLVAAARIELNGYWGIHIYSYQDNGKLITSGIYSKCRHPVYSGQIFMTLGTFMLTNNWWVILFPVGTTILSVWRAYREEQDLAERFKKDFKVYKNKTSFIIPYI